MNRTWLVVIYVLVVLSMLAITTWASLERSVLDNAELLRDRWFLATLQDAYLAFLTIGLWVCYKLRSWWSRLAWLIALLLLGNLAIGVFILWQLIKWDPAGGIAGLLLNQDDLARRPSPAVADGGNQ